MNKGDETYGLLSSLPVASEATKKGCHKMASEFIWSAVSGTPWRKLPPVNFEKKICLIFVAVFHEKISLTNTIKFSISFYWLQFSQTL